MACEDASRRFALDVFTGCARDCRADVLTLDGRPIAVILAIRAGRTGFAIKRAYDESYRAFGPGRILDFEMTRNFFAEKWAERVDSGTSGRHVIDSLWPERMKMAQLVFSFDRRRGERDVSRACAAYRQTRRIKTLVAGAWSGVTHQTLRGLVARGKGSRPSMRMR
jgi:hypothetical protein